MILRIELPKTNNAIEGAIVEQWHKKIGDAIGHGDDLVDIHVEKVKRRRRKSRMKLLDSMRPRTARSFAVKGAHFRVRIAALDSGTLATIDAPEGTRVKEGSLLATLSSEGGSRAAPTDHTEAAVARVVVNRAETPTENVDS